MFKNIFPVVSLSTINVHHCTKDNAALLSRITLILGFMLLH